MLVRQQDVSQLGQWNIGQDELPRDAVAAVNDVCCAIHYDHLRRCRPRFSRTRAASSAEQDQPGVARLARSEARKQSAAQSGSVPENFSSSAHRFIDTRDGR